MDEQLILDRYRLIERLAVGGSAEVWRAHDEQLDRAVAVKRLHPHLLPDAASRKRLAAEARAAAGLSHPVIVDVYDVDAEGEAAALVMELVDGESLAARLERDGPLAVRDAVRVTADVADALYHAHQRGVVHRDVKPGNVLLARDGRVRLVDFGIAHSLAASAERLTLTGTVVGTMRAIAPEQLAGGPVSPRTDLYGLGVVLHEGLTGRPPYPSGSPMQLAEAQRAGRLDLSGIDPALAAVIRSCLSFEPADRPLHAGALAAALRAWLAGDSAPALGMAPAVPPAADGVDTAAITQPIPAVAPAAAQAAAPAAASGGRRSMAGPLALLAGLAALALGAAVVLGGWGRSPDVGGGGPSPSPTPSPVSPTPTATPTWLADLVEKVVKECGEISPETQAELGSLPEGEAKELADALVEECKDGDGGGGNGSGRGGGGNGRGGDD